MLRSLLLTAIVSTLFAYGLANWIGFLPAFALSTGVQFVVFWVINSFNVTNKEALYAEFEGELDAVLSLSRVSAECPCGDYIFDVDVFANAENIFRCPKCNNSVELGLMKDPVLKTDPSEVTGE
tara:strand:+ start:66 stop:437 length:372 start_codon:yes stop_codon:yes gene_type:complete